MSATIIKQEITKLKNKWKGKIYLSNYSVVQFSISKSSNWKQWGASKDELWITQPIVERYWNEYLDLNDIL
jgi:hypothetical protein